MDKQTFINKDWTKDFREQSNNKKIESVISQCWICGKPSNLSIDLEYKKSEHGGDHITTYTRTFSIRVCEECCKKYQNDKEIRHTAIIYSLGTSFCLVSFICIMASILSKEQDSTPWIIVSIVLFFVSAKLIFWYLTNKIAHLFYEDIDNLFANHPIAIQARMDGFSNTNWLHLFLEKPNTRSHQKSKTDIGNIDEIIVNNNEKVNNIGMLLLGISIILLFIAILLL